MSRYIDADALKKSIDECDVCNVCPERKARCNYDCEFPDHLTPKFEALIDAQPIIEPKRGEWIPCTKSGLALTELMRREGQKWYGYRCSNCNHIYKGNALKDCNFCCCCGADMRGKGND